MQTSYTVRRIERKFYNLYNLFVKLKYFFDKILDTISDLKYYSTYLKYNSKYDIFVKTFKFTCYKKLSDKQISSSINSLDNCLKFILKQYFEIYILVLFL